jgi:chromosome segregation ATPase
MNKKNNTRNNDIAYGYYSKLLMKPFDTIEELKEAEEAYYTKQKAKEDAITQKKADAQKVEDAFKALNVARKAYKEDLTQLTKEYADALDNLKQTFDLGKKDIANKLGESENAYKAALDAFTEKYGQYHFTITGDDFEATISGNATSNTNVAKTINADIFDIFNSFFNW